MNRLGDHTKGPGNRRFTACFVRDWPALMGRTHWPCARRTGRYSEVMRFHSLTTPERDGRRSFALSCSALSSSPFHRSQPPGLTSAAWPSRASPLRRGFQHRSGFPVFRQVLAGLREHCPAAMPVIVRTSVLPGTTLGLCARRQYRFVIRLNTFLNEHVAVDTLLHEWAHALSWHLVLDNLSKHAEMEDDEFEQAAHDEVWGCAYSRVWRVYIGHILPALPNTR